MNVKCPNPSCKKPIEASDSMLAKPFTCATCGGTLMILTCPNPQCKKKLPVPEKAFGKKGKCGACGSGFHVPATSGHHTSVEQPVVAITPPSQQKEVAENLSEICEIMKAIGIEPREVPPDIQELAIGLARVLRGANAVLTFESLGFNERDWPLDYRNSMLREALRSVSAFPALEGKESDDRMTQVAAGMSAAIKWAEKTQIDSPMGAGAHLVTLLSTSGINPILQLAHIGGLIGLWEVLCGRTGVAFSRSELTIEALGKPIQMAGWMRQFRTRENYRQRFGRDLQRAPIRASDYSRVGKVDCAELEELFSKTVALLETLLRPVREWPGITVISPRVQDILFVWKCELDWDDETSGFVLRDDRISEFLAAPKNARYLSYSRVSAKHIIETAFQKASTQFTMIGNVGCLIVIVIVVVIVLLIRCR